MKHSYWFQAREKKNPRAPEQTENEGHNSSLGLASHTACPVAADSVLLGQVQRPDLSGWQPVLGLTAAPLQP